MNLMVYPSPSWSLKSAAGPSAGVAAFVAVLAMYVLVTRQQNMDVEHDPLD